MIPVGSVTIGGGGSACTEVIVAVGPAFVRFAYTRSLSPFGFLEADHQNSALLLGATRCASAGSTRQGLVSLPCATSSSTASQLSDLAYGPQVTRTTPLRSASERFEKRFDAVSWTIVDSNGCCTAHAARSRSHKPLQICRLRRSTTRLAHTLLQPD